MTKTWIVTENFSAAHLYHQPKWSKEENQACFGKCFTEHGHGHNYTLEVGFKGPQSPLAALQTKVKVTTDVLDHQHLNFMIPEFRDVIPTTENIAQYLLQKLQQSCPNEGLSYIKLYEMNDLWVEIHV